jgi:serine/threonine protein kinase/formylglycine-generating enzyme required for sulfatase activity
VQSTATGELMARLAKAPKLDEQRFTLDGELGRGGMGLVLEIHDRFLNRRLAMKVLLERGTPRDEEEQRLTHQLLGRFLEEAQVTSQLDHPGVVPVHELGLDQSGKVYFTMRMVKGKTASERFADAFHRRNDWDLTRALEVILKVCDTMSYAHDKGVLHRDLKPANVMVGRFGEVYVMDWGLAKVLGQPDRHDLRIRPDATTGVSRLETARKRDAETDAENSVVSMDGQQLGTPSYMSPEQARSEDLDARADVYSIGAMLYELVTGSAPYAPRGLRLPPYRILREVVEGPPTPITNLQKDVPAELCAVIDKAMARERSERYASTAALAADVRAFLAQRVVAAYRTGAWQETKLWVKRNRPLAASLAAAMLLLVAGIAVAASLARSEAQARQDAVAQQQAAERNAAAATAAQQAAERSAANAAAAQRSADAKAKELAAKVAEFDQLALVVDYDRLMKESPELGTAYPEQLPAITDWLQRAQRLLGRQEELAAVVAAVRQSAGGVTAGQPTPTPTPADPEAAAAAANPAPAASGAGAQAAAQFLAQSLGDLLGKLPKLAEMVPAMQQRQRWATAVESLTMAHPNARVTWAEARAAVAASPKYAGQEIPLRDRDVLGMVPIGANPQSGLWEFYDLRSAWDGASDPALLAKLAIPAHGADGRIAMTGASGIVWVLLPGGTLPAGTPVDDEDEDEKRRLAVRLDPFFLAKHELTQGQWQRWTGANPSDSKDRNDLSLPVETVNWYQCRDTLAQVGLVLPSELQWEYAIRAGTTTAWWTGDDEKAVLAAENIGADDAKLLPVGSKQPNPFGLFDMGGNLWEWCYDEYGDYGSERAGDGRRPDPDSDPLHRCYRGGGFDYVPGYARSDFRYDFYDASLRFDGLGARPARTSRR